ncbi:MAG: hypothetical protein F4X80_07940 [Chloroflexi bacterium]|nr:hypothetical protein [Chloroflexota bacterium]
MFDRIHHAGLAVADLAAAKTVFADGLGLIVDTTRSPLPYGNKQRGADPTDILDIPIGNSELELNAPPTDGTTPGGTHRFIEQRGGVGALHHICVHASDTPNDIAHLRAAGLRLIGATEEELASDEPWTQVAFFHPRDTEGVLLEIWPADNHRVGDRYQGEGVFTRLSHIGVVTDDLDRSRKFWTNVMGLQVDTLRTSIMKGGRLVDGEDVRVLAMPVGDTEGHDVVAIMPQSGGSGTGRFLERYGGSAHGTMHHFGIATPDVKAAADFVQERGMELVAPANDEFAWIHPRSAGGMLIQIVQDTQ